MSISKNLFYDLPKGVSDIIVDYSKDGLRFNVIKQPQGRNSYKRWIEIERIQYKRNYDDIERDDSSDFDEEECTGKEVLDPDTFKELYNNFREKIDCEFKHDEEYDSCGNMELYRLQNAYEWTTEFLQDVYNKSAPKTKYRGKYNALIDSLYNIQCDRDSGYSYWKYTFDKECSKPPVEMYVLWYISGGGCGCGCFTQRFPVAVYSNAYRAENFRNKFKNYLVARNFDPDDNGDDEYNQDRVYMNRYKYNQQENRYDESLYNSEWT